MLHPLCHNVESFLSYTGLSVLKESFIFVWDTDNPDYIIVSEHINTNQKYRNELKRLYGKRNIKIYFAGEAEYPDFNLYDFAVGFGSDLRFGDRYCSLPSPYKFFDGFITRRINPIVDVESAKIELSKKTGFCNFLYSNPNAHPMRDKLFHEISKYKKVDSLGKHLNNVGRAGTGFVGHANECVELKSRYKFSIASENATFPGYTSEKILTSLESHTVPIYWGDPLIVKHINPDCFINCNEMDSIDDIIAAIKRVDRDDIMWCNMVSSPWQTEDQIHYSLCLDQKYAEFFQVIFSNTFETNKRIPEGTRPNIYRAYYFNAKSNEQSLFSIAKNKIRRFVQK